MEEIKVKIDGIEISLSKKLTIMEAAKSVGIVIPNLCYLPNVCASGNCRICMVEVTGLKKPITSCNTYCTNGMEIFTNTPLLIKERKIILELLLASHNRDCLSCNKSENCKLQHYSNILCCSSDKYKTEKKLTQIDDSSKCIVRDNSKCILCNKCVEICSNVQNVDAIGKIERGFNTHIACAFEKPLAESTCVGCGQCVVNCPTGALMVKSDKDKLNEILNDKMSLKVVQFAPAVRVALAEEWGRPVGTYCEGELITALKMLGFDKVFDVNFGADLTVVEEANELIERLNKPNKYPLFSSCCPAWFAYMNEFHKDISNNLSTCKSPNEMLGSLTKAYFKKQGYENVKVVAIMPCTAKKAEITRGEDVDAVITTSELAHILKSKNVNLPALPKSNFDGPFGDYSGAGLIFGTTGGVTEAVLRYVYQKLSHEKLECFDFFETRGQGARKVLSININNQEIKIAIVNGLLEAEKLLDDIKHGKAKFDFVEVMACPYGCVNGGGQPSQTLSSLSKQEIAMQRANSIYDKDKLMKIRATNENKKVDEIYQNFLSGNNLAHELLHYKH